MIVYNTDQLNSGSPLEEQQFLACRRVHQKQIEHRPFPPHLNRSESRWITLLPINELRVYEVSFHWIQSLSVMNRGVRCRGEDWDQGSGLRVGIQDGISIWMTATPYPKHPTIITHFCPYIPSKDGN